MPTATAENPTLAPLMHSVNPELHKLNFRTLIVTSLIGGFFLIPLHEFGHVLCDWITGHPAAMSYARDYLLSGEKTPFLGLLGGPLFPLMMSAVCVILVYRGVHLSVTYPLAILGTLDRLVLYLAGVMPSDEWDLAHTLAWPPRTFKYIFMSCEIAILALIVLSMIRYRTGIKRSILAFVIVVAGFVTSAAFGVFVVDRYLFPEQHKKEFGMVCPHNPGASSVSDDLVVAGTRLALLTS